MQSSTKVSIWSILALNKFADLALLGILLRSIWLALYYDNIIAYVDKRSDVVKWAEPPPSASETLALYMQALLIM